MVYVMPRDGLFGKLLLIRVLWRHSFQIQLCWDVAAGKRRRCWSV